MADWAVQGGSSGTWGTEYYNFIALSFQISGPYGGDIAIVVNENEVVCNEDQVVMNTDRSLQ